MRRFFVFRIFKFLFPGTMKNLLYILLFSPLFLFGQAISYEEENIPLYLPEGWSIFGYTCIESIDVIVAFSEIISNIVIVKDASGNAYLPDWNYNGIGALEFSRGYQIKLNTQVDSFQFCDTPNISSSHFQNQIDSLQAVLDTIILSGCIPQVDFDNIQNELDIANYTLSELQQQVYQLLSLGDYFQGGYIFYLDESGQHGLVAAPENVGGEIEDIYGNSGLPWGCVGIDINSVGLDSSGAIGTGHQNTLDIVNACTETPIAASVCLEYENDGYTDWYLPSFHELNLLCEVIGMNSIYLNFALFDDDGYWTSNQNYSHLAWYYNFDLCSPFTNPRENLKRVRAIRSF